MSKEFFRDVATRWDDMRKAMYSEAVRERAIESAKVEQGQRAVDVGAGTGFVTEGLIERGVATVAVDPSGPMLEQLRKKFLRSSLLTVKIGNGERIPLLANRFDAAFANMSLHHAEDPSKMILEMARILKPGGRLALTDLDAHPHEWMKEAHHDRWMGFKRADVASWCRAAGLDKVEVADAGTECCTSATPDGREVKIKIFLASAVKPFAGASRAT